MLVIPADPAVKEGAFSDVIVLCVVTVRLLAVTLPRIVDNELRLPPTVTSPDVYTAARFDAPITERLPADTLDRVAAPLASTVVRYVGTYAVSDL